MNAKNVTSLTLGDILKGTSNKNRWCISIPRKVRVWKRCLHSDAGYYFLCSLYMSTTTSTSNIKRPVSVILTDPNHVLLNVESFTDSRTLIKSLANYCKLDQANIVNAINRTEAAAERTNYLQNQRANLIAVS